MAASSSPKVKVITSECFLIRDALTMKEQVELSAYIHDRDRTPQNEPRAMVPAPRTLVLGDDGASPTVKYRRGDASVVTTMVDQGVACLKRENLGLTGITNDIAEYTSLSMATIRYEAPNGRFPPHVDHCKDSAVFLVSLGRSANFMVRGREETEVRRFQLQSGDALVFDASTEAGLLHGVESIDVAASDAGEALAQEFPVFRTHRYGVQCRMHF
uniref:Alpha-ketoglutarate-dependent dioxygenase AlkB-like domain-containing protein n=2 Tax=Ditylum brightwellii TaxID=49249 RepID=A0A6U3QHH8_9STRA|mmetsp:Transcript_29749/g.43285  ORF Transcript_29749/g.43285 Transcript_29749/m.43285 type:complete len:215 (+) Transcript_29749:58-702(+)